jgi:SIR2-like domain
LRTPDWEVTPRGRRNCAALGAAVRASAEGGPGVVLLVGAGADQALGRRPSWDDLLRQVLLDAPLPLSQQPSHQIFPDQLLSRAGTWPEEAAEALKVTLGSAGFTSGLTSALSRTAGNEGSTGVTTFADALVALVRSGIRCVVSLNYTDDVPRTLRENLSDDTHVRVINRSELAAWPLEALLTPPPGSVHVLKIHGSLPGLSSRRTTGIVLDRSSYTAMASEGSFYRSVLERMFGEHIVVTLGVSWRDAPLREAAARSRLRRPITFHPHYMVRQQQADRGSEWWEERLLAAAFGLRSLGYARHEEVPKLLRQVARHAGGAPIYRGELGPAALPTPMKDSMAQIAKWLDGVGDYESTLQSQWFAKWAEKVLARFDQELAAPDLSGGDEWLVYARIERHLRHFLWFRLSADRRRAARTKAWGLVARAWQTLPQAERTRWRDAAAMDDVLDGAAATVEDGLGYRAVLDFAIGAWEANEGREDELVADWVNWLRYVRRSMNGRILAHRISLAELTWGLGRPASHEANAARLGQQLELARVGRWESMEAKVQLDVVQGIARELAEKGSQGAPPLDVTPRKWQATDRQRVREHASHAVELARVSGATRREIGAIVIGALVTPPAEAEADLIGAYRRVQAVGVDALEASATWSVVTGLVAVYLDQGGPDAPGPKSDLIHWITNKCPELRVTREDHQAVVDNFAPHWSTFHPRAAELSTVIAEALASQVQGT